MKRFFCLLLTLTLMAAVSAACAEEEREIRTEGDYRYALLDDGTAEITAYWGYAEAVQIPAELGGKPVTRIGERAFEYFTFANVTIPDGVTDIGAYAFFTCDSLESVAIPDSVTGLGDNAFDSCYSLAEVTIPASVTSIGDNVFRWCFSLTGVTIPDSVTSIGYGAFSWCRGLRSVTIPGSVTDIGAYAFYTCDSLAYAVIPDSVTSIGEYAFACCPSLTVTVSRGSYAERYCAENGIRYIFPDADGGRFDGAFPLP